MKRILFVLAAVTVLFSAVPSAFGKEALAAPADELLEQQLRQFDTDPISRYWIELAEKYGGFFPENKVPSFAEIIVPGGEGVRLADVLKGMARFFFHEILYNGKLLVSIIVLTVFSMILETLQRSFEGKTVSRVAYAITYMVLIIIAFNSFSVAVHYAKSAIEDMIHFMIAIVPLLLTLMTSMGNFTTVTIIHPLIVFMIHTIGTLIYMVVFPLLFFSAVLYIVSALTDRYQVTQLAGLLRNIGVGLLGIFLTVFLGVVSVQGITGSVIDGFTVRAAKYVSGNFVPVIGKMFSDAADIVIGASLLVKNAIGLVGVLIIVILCAFPAIKILTLAIIYNLSAAIMQPLGNSPIIVCLDTIGKSLIYIFASLASVGLMFFLALTIIITAGTVSVMMR